MYAAAESLIANKVAKINIPSNWTADGTSLGKNFEIYSEREVDLEDSNMTEPRTYATSVFIKPENPAIGTGGGVPVCGMNSSQVHQSLLLMISK